MGGKVGNYYPVRVQPRQRGRGARYYSWLAAGGASITISVAIRNVIPPPPHQRPPPASPAVKRHDLLELETKVKRRFAKIYYYYGLLLVESAY